MPTTKKPHAGKSTGKRSASRKATTAGAGTAKTASRSGTRKLWAYIKQTGRAERQTKRPIFDTPVQLRNLDAADIARMVSGAKIKLS